MSSEDLTTADDETTDERPDDDPATLRARIEVLEAENEQLREEYARAKRSQYRQTAIGLVALGVVGALGGLLFPDARTLLFALAGTGAFLGLLTYYLTPEQFLSAAVGESVYDALARTESDAVTELGLHDERVYVPAGGTGVRLFVPQRSAYEVPDADALSDVFLVTDDEGARGVSLAPTGDGLASEFEQAAAGGPAEDPATLAEQVGDALVEQFELVGTATPDVDPDGGRVTLLVDESAYGAVDRFDHPVVSFAASAFARSLDEPVTATVETASDERGDYRATLTWETASDSEATDQE